MPDASWSAKRVSQAAGTPRHPGGRGRDGRRDGGPPGAVEGLLSGLAGKEGTPALHQLVHATLDTSSVAMSQEHGEHGRRSHVRPSAPIPDVGPVRWRREHVEGERSGPKLQPLLLKSLREALKADEFVIASRDLTSNWRPG